MHVENIPFIIPKNEAETAFIHDFPFFYTYNAVSVSFCYHESKYFQERTSTKEHQTHQDTITFIRYYMFRAIDIFIRKSRN